MAIAPVLANRGKETYSRLIVSDQYSRWQGYGFYQEQWKKNVPWVAPIRDNQVFNG